jgi:hypothetical protein
MAPSDRAWIVLGVGVVCWDVSCKEGMTLSEAVDSYLVRRPLLTRLVILGVAAHLLNLLSPRIDILHLGFVGARNGFVGVRRLRRPL